MESTPQRFEERAVATRWLHSTFESWAASLTEAERDALRAYKHTAYERLNEALRMDLPLDVEDEDMVGQLDLALSRFRLPEPVIAFRGHDARQLAIADVGDEIVDFGFTSTSLLRRVAEEFAPAIAEILIPGGVNVGAFVGAPDLVEEGGELEILLPRESRFRIVSQATTIELEVVVT